MTCLPRLEHAAEYLDAPIHDPAELEASLEDVAAVNRWLGGRRALLAHLAPLLSPDHPTTLLDAGTGSADLPRAIARWARRHRRPIHLLALDLNEQTLAIARRQSACWPELRFARADARSLPLPDAAVDVALLSLTLHHLEGEDQLAALRELGRVSRRAVLVGELERNVPAYLGARLLSATLWRTNRLTRHDGPVSVRRAFTPGELLALARAAGLAHPRVYRHPLFRLVLVAGLPAGSPTPHP